VARIAVAGLALLAALTTIPVFLSASLAARAAATWPQRPAGALADLHRAGDIDPLSSDAPLQEGLVAAAVGDRVRARSAFAEAARRDSRGWFARLELAILSAQGGDRAGALRLLAEVARLNPREPSLATTRAGILRGRPPDPLAVARGVVKRGG
jgi:tetratricopeptide (TPR) repeat protein